MGSLDGRVCVVTGGNGGIGLGMAHALATAGADVAVWGRNEAKNAAAAEELAGHGTRVVALACDVGEEDAVVGTFAATVDRLGKVDCLIANAGVAGLVPFTAMSLEEWRRVQRVDLDGVFLCFREAARHLVDRGEGGSLVGISSISAIHGAPAMEHYASAKAGVNALVRGLAVELARHHVRVNAIVPGWTESGMLSQERSSRKFVETTISRTPVRRWGAPEDLGPAAVFLADPTYTFHTGDCLVVDGGYTVF